MNPQSKIMFFGLLSLFLATFTACDSNHKDKERFILAEDFRGEVIIVFDQQNGKDEIYSEDGYRIYEIPENGILFTSFKKNDGWGKSDECQILIQKNGRLDTIYNYSPNSLIKADSILVSHQHCVGDSEGLNFQSFLVDFEYNFGKDKYYSCGDSPKIDSLLNEFGDS